MPAACGGPRRQQLRGGLDLNGNNRIGDAGVAVLVGCLAGCKLKLLRLGGVGLGLPGCRALSRGIKDSCVEELVVGGNAAIGDAGVAALAVCLAECKLKSLHLNYVGLGAGGCRALMQHLAFTCVELLNLIGNLAIGDAGVEAVAERLTDCGLTCLRLGDVGLGEAGCRMLVQGILGSCVETVSWGNRAIRGEGAEALRAACAVRDELRVFGNHDGFSRHPVAREPPCAADVVVVVDVVFLCGILPWLVAHPVFLYSGSGQQ